MSAEGLIAALVLTTVAVMIVVLPLLIRGAEDDEASLSRKQRERLAAYYERVLRNLRDLDEDHALGKLDDADYQYDRAEWLQRGAHVLRALDALEHPTETAHIPLARTTADDAAVDRAIDEAVEAAIQAYRNKQGSHAN
jgi:cytochrome c-type biogenesis protein CcmI